MKNTQLIKERVRKNIPNFVILILSLVIFLLAFELVVRSLELSSGYDYPEGLFQSDDLLGYSMVPDFKGKFVKQEFETDISTNSYGLRDYEYGEKNEFRILALGDSFVWGGYGTEINQTFVKVLEKELNSNLEEKYKVINAGVVGYELDQELLYLENKGVNFNPDLVILNFFVGNDFRESEDVTVKGGFLVNEKSETKKIEIIRTYLLLNLHSYRVVERGVINIFEKFIQKHIRGKYQDDEYESNLFLEGGIERIDKTKEILNEMKNYLDDKNIDFVVVIIPLKYQVDDNLKQIFIDNNYQEKESYDMELPQKIIKDWGEENKVLVIDLLPKMKELNVDNDFYWKLNPHFNVEGNYVVGEIIFENIKDEIVN